MENQPPERKPPGKFDLVFSGRFSKGIHQDQIRVWLMENFNLTGAAADRFFSGRAFAIKRGIDREKAGQFKEKLDQGGVICDIVPAPRPDPPGPTPSSSVGRDTIQCPKCGFEQAQGRECSRCGVILAKVQGSAPGGQKPREQAQDVHDYRRGTGKAIAFVLGLIMVFFMGGGFYIWSRLDESDKSLYYNYKRYGDFRAMRRAYASDTTVTLDAMKQGGVFSGECQLDSKAEFIQMLKRGKESEINNAYSCAVRFCDEDTVVPLMNWYGSLRPFRQRGNEEAILSHLLSAGGSVEGILTDMLDTVDNPGVLGIITQFLCIYDSKQSMLRLADYLIHCPPEEKIEAGRHLKLILGSCHFDVNTAFNLALSFCSVKSLPMGERLVQSLDLFKGPQAQMRIAGCGIGADRGQIQLFSDQSAQSGKKDRLTNAFYKMLLK